MCSTIKENLLLYCCYRCHNFTHFDMFWLKRVNEINWFFVFWYKFRKPKSYFDNFWVDVDKNGRGVLGHRTLKNKKWIWRTELILCMLIVMQWFWNNVFLTFKCQYLCQLYLFIFRDLFCNTKQCIAFLKLSVANSICMILKCKVVIDKCSNCCFQ